MLSWILRKDKSAFLKKKGSAAVVQYFEGRRSRRFLECACWDYDFVEVVNVTCKWRGLQSAIDKFWVLCTLDPWNARTRKCCVLERARRDVLCTPRRQCADRHVAWTILLENSRRESVLPPVSTIGGTWISPSVLSVGHGHGTLRPCAVSGIICDLLNNKSEFEGAADVQRGQCLC